MKENFDKAIEFVFKMEGGYSNDKSDRGGETKFGIARKFHKDIPAEKWEHFTLADAKQIYKCDYWDAAGCDDLPFPFDVYVFDCAVNMGVGVAKKILAASQTPEDYINRRVAKYRAIAEIGDNKKFIKGWIGRATKLAFTFQKESKDGNTQINT